MRFSIIAIVTLALLSIQCTFDNEEDFFNDKEGSCNTENVSFSSQVLPVMTANCTSCHNTGNPSGGINLSGYEQIKNAAKTGRLIGSIRHEDGYSKMPQSGNKLPDCTISQIEAWIEQGMKNN